MPAGGCCPQSAVFAATRKGEAQTMKATGIVRRIDDLGRVVIPKEIRRTLHIRVGEPLEIYVSGDGEVIFKKYSPLGELAGPAVQLAEVLAKASGRAVLVADCDHVVTVSGASRREWVDQRLAPDFAAAMEGRRLLAPPAPEAAAPVENAPLAALALAPILAQGDVIGAVALLGESGAPRATEAESKLIAVAAAFLGRQMEE